MLLAACESRSNEKTGRKVSHTPNTPQVDQKSTADANKGVPSTTDDKQSSTPAGDNTPATEIPSNPSPNVDPNAYTCLEAPQQFDCDTEELIFNATNKARTDAGLSPFRLDVKLGWLARDWSQQMAAANRLSHDGFPSARNQRYQSKFGVAISVPMEICAGGGGVMPRDERTIAGSMMQAWYSSQAHMDQMLNPNFKSVGIGVAPDSSGRWYATQIFGF